MNINDLRELDYSNAISLPNAIRKELEKGGYGFTVELDGTYYSHNVFNNLNADISLATDEAKLKLYVDFNKNLSLAIVQYVAGFRDGFRDRTFLIGYPEEENKIFQIYSGVVKKGNPIHNPNILSFKKNVHVYNDLRFLKKQLYNYGYAVGCFIRNWTIIFNNVNLFEKIFEEKLGTKANYSLEEQIKTDESINNKTLTLQNILKGQNKLLPKISIEKVYNHFKILTTATNKNGQYYLTEEQLLIFINSTFIEQKPIKQKFSCNGFFKVDIRKIFYAFYFENKQVETNQAKLKRKYFNILHEGFEGFSENDYIDFAK